ncbi:hypothetical protein, partial [Caballeronia arvi]|uniref:hypothetical protein n=1 Tax=Caballeronia arvi TaxID=1777135 RepID=UPI001F349379
YDACPHAPLVRAQLHGEGQASYKPKLVRQFEGSRLRRPAPLPPTSASGQKRSLVMFLENRHS